MKNYFEDEDQACLALFAELELVEEKLCDYRSQDTSLLSDEQLAVWSDEKLALEHRWLEIKADVAAGLKVQRFAGRKVQSRAGRIMQSWVFV
jgi:hypothetical protein